VTSFNKPKSKSVTDPRGSIVRAYLALPVCQLTKNANVDITETLSKHTVIGGSVDGINEWRSVFADHSFCLGIPDVQVK
jgi:hypothetical protein